MPLSDRIVGQSTGEFRYHVDARWLMAYAAGIDDLSPCYLDTTGAITAHPIFPVCLEWDAILALRHGPGSESMSDLEQPRAVHAEHDLHLFAPIRPESELTTTGTAIAIEQRSPGAYLIKRLDTRDQHGTLVCRTYQGTLYRGVAITGTPMSLETPPALPAIDHNCSVVHPLTIGAGAAHTYTECARIWNPIHTDRAQALAAGLPDLILHGTATLARAVSVLIRHYLNSEPTRVKRIGCRFSGMVLMPSELNLMVESCAPSLLGFRLTNAQGQDVIKHGFVVSDRG